MSRRENREREEREEKERKKIEKENIKRQKAKKKQNQNKKTEKNTKDKKKKNKSSVGKIIGRTFIIILLILLLVLGCYVGWLGSTCDWQIDKMFKKTAKQVALAITGQTEEDVLNLDPIYCLVLGISTDEKGTALTDTIILCAYYPKTQQASMFSIPRDTFVGRSKSTAGSYDKINAQYQAGGIEKILSSVKSLTGIDVNNYVIVKNAGVIQLVDAIGGVEFDVPIDMDYDDWGQDLHIHLNKGRQRLNGDQAEGLLRFRHNNNNTSYPTEYGDNDIGRMRTQREFITETLKQTLRVGNVTKINELIQIAFNNIETNLDMNYVMKYSPAAIEFDVSAIQTAYAPGVPRSFGPYNLSFYEVNKTETKEIVEELFTFKQQEYDSGEEGTVSLKPSNIKLQVLNATGDNKILEDTVKRLENKGYKVTETGETTVAKTTKVINRTSKKEDVIDELIDTLGYGDISEGQDKASYDFTIIVGQDMKQFGI